MPTANTQYITASSGYDGLNQVTVNRDNNLIAENIKSRISIFGVTGNYNGALTVQAVNISLTELTLQRNGVSDVIINLSFQIRNFVWEQKTYLALLQISSRTSDFTKQIGIFLYLYFTYNSVNNVTQGNLDENVPSTYGFFTINGSTYYPLLAYNTSTIPCFTIASIDNTSLSLTGDMSSSVDRLPNVTEDFKNLDRIDYGFQIIY